MYLKTFTNLKMGASVAAGAVGPRSFAAATTWLSAMVPVKGASRVCFILRSTDSNATAAAAINVGNSSDGVGTLNITSNGGTLVGSTTNRMDKGGERISAFMTIGGFVYDFAQLSVTSHATLTHTEFQVDVEVWFNGDADVIRADAGQASVVPV